MLTQVQTNGFFIFSTIKLKIIALITGNPLPIKLVFCNKTYFSTKTKCT